MTEEEEILSIEAEAAAALAKKSQPPAAPDPNAPGKMESFLRGAVDMLLFGADDEIGAGVRTGFGYLGNYDEDVAESRALKEEARDTNPWSFGAGNLVGSVPSMMVPGLNAVRGASFGSNLIRGAFGGAAMGGAYGLGSGEGGLTDRLDDAGQGMLVGGTVGAAAPVVGRGVGAVWRALTGRATPAARIVARGIRDDVGDTAGAQRGLDELGPDAMVADLGTNLQRQAGAVASVPGRGQTIVTEALRNRQRGTNARILGDTDAAIGAAPVPRFVEEGFDETRQALGPLYERALQGAKAVDTQPIANEIDSMLPNVRGPAQAALRDIRTQLDITGAPGTLDPSPRTLLEVRHSIDGILEGATTDNNTRRVLRIVRRQVDAELANKVPDIKAVDSQFADVARQREAFQRGRTALDSGRESLHPQEIARDMAAGPTDTMMGPSGVPIALRQGARAEIDRLLRTNTNDAVKMQGILKGEGSWNRDRLVQLFGEERAGQLFHILERESRFAATAKRALENSETAARQLAQEEIAPAARQNSGLIRKALNPLTWSDALMHIPDRVRAGNMARRSGNTQEEVGHLLTGGDDTIQAIARALLELRRSEGVEAGVTRALTAGGRGGVVPLEVTVPIGGRFKVIGQ